MTATPVPGRRRRGLPSFGLRLHGRTRVLVLGGGLILLLALLAVAAVTSLDAAWRDRILPGTSVAGVDLSGATAAEARARLAEVVPAHRTIVVRTGRESRAVATDALGRAVDVDTAIATALARGRGYGALDGVRAWLGITGPRVDVPVGVRVEPATLDAWLTNLAGRLAVAPRSAMIVGDADGWHATPETRGRALDVAGAAAALTAALTGADPSGVVVDLPLATILPDTTDVEASLALWEARRMSAPVRVRVGDEAWTLPSAGLRDAVAFVSRDGRPVATASAARLRAALQAFAPELARAARQTRFLLARDGRTVGFLPGAAGRRMAVEPTTARLALLLERRRTGEAELRDPLTPAMVVVEPRVSATEAAKLAPRMRRLSTWTTHFPVGERNAYGANITIPARLINGTVVHPGEVFDFWRAVGPITRARGYGLGGVIQNGHTNPTGALGGGICSASTTMFNAAVRAGYEILERHPHYYYITRYPLGLDATVSGSGRTAAQDMRFRNDTDVPLLIRGTWGYGWVRFEIYSVDTGRTVSWSRPSVSNVRHASDGEKKTDALPRGTTERAEYPADGMDVVVVRTVRDADGHLVHRDRFVSHYARVDGILLVGTR